MKIFTRRVRLRPVAEAIGTTVDAMLQWPARTVDEITAIYEEMTKDGPDASS